MIYVVIEYFGDPVIVTNEDGSPLLFDNLTDAQAEARDCQNGIVVPLSTSLIDDIKRAAEAVWILDEIRDEENGEELRALEILLGRENE